MSKIESLIISADEKIINGNRPYLYENRTSIMKNEYCMFQIAYCGENCDYNNVVIDIVSELKNNINIRETQPVCCNLFNREICDNYVLCNNNSTITDILKDKTEIGLTVRYNIWNSAFVKIGGDICAGNYKIVFKLIYNNEVLSELEYYLEVKNFTLPESDLCLTNWIHYDCLCDIYNVYPLSDEFFTILDRYIDNYVKHGFTCLYIPLFTPPLDTEIGKERKVVQTVNVVKKNSKYFFDFSLVQKIINIAKKRGIKYFEFSHLFTQWGAANAPQIWIEENGKINQKFGWNTNSESNEYLYFIKKLIIELRLFIYKNNIEKYSFLHISDEPSVKILVRYKKIYKTIKDNYPESIIIDALSDYEFYSEGCNDIPVVALDHVDKFIDNGIYKYMVYYCMGQRNGYVSNAFISTPCERTRIIGFQMYLNGAFGLLHWGYNYYYSFLSKVMLNPYYENDSGGVFPSGDGFCVYPGQNGYPVDSVREEVLLEAFQDYRLCLLAEKKVGNEVVKSLLTENGMKKYNLYIHSSVWLKNLREKIIDLL